VIAVVASSGGFLLLLSVGLLLWWILHDDRPARVVPKGPVAVGPGPGWDRPNALDRMKKELKEIDPWKDQGMFPDKGGFIDRILPFDAKKPDGPFRDRRFPDKILDDKMFVEKRPDKEVFEKRVEPPPKVVPPVRPVIGVRTIRSPQADFTNLRFSPDGKVLATTNAGSQLQVWEADSGRLLGTLPFTPPKGPASLMRVALAFTPDSRQVAVWSGNGPVLVADATTGKQLHSLTTDRSYIPWGVLDISPDGKTLIACLGRSVKAWSLDTGNPVELPRNPKVEPKELVISALFTSDTTLLTATLSLAAKQREERLWNIKDGSVGEPLKLFTGGTPFTRVEVSPSRTIAYFQVKANLEFSDPQTGKQLLRLSMPPGRILSASNSVAFLPGERVIVTNHLDRSVTFWEFPSGRELRHVPLEPDGVRPGLNPPSGVAVCPEGRYLATLRGGAVTLWDLNDLMPRPEVPPR
jgi:WD40 repeat protein